MLTGDQIKQARERAGWSQQELADRIGVTRRTVGNYEANRVATSRSAETRLMDALGRFVDEPSESDPLRLVSDASLLAEIARRFDRARKTERQEQAHAQDETSITRGGGSPPTGTQPDELAERRQMTPEEEQESVTRAVGTAARHGKKDKPGTDQSRDDEGTDEPS